MRLTPQEANERMRLMYKDHLDKFVDKVLKQCIKAMHKGECDVEVIWECCRTIGEAAELVLKSHGFQCNYCNRSPGGEYERKRISWKYEFVERTATHILQDT